MTPGRNGARKGLRTCFAIASFTLCFVGCQGEDARIPAEFTAPRVDWAAEFCGLGGGGVGDPGPGGSGLAAPDTLLHLEAGRIGATATSPDGVVVVFDDLSSRLVVLSDDGHFAWFGGPGSGPGEFAGGAVGVERDHVSASGQSYLVFDGARIHEFDRAGRPLFSRSLAELGIPRIHLVGLRSTIDTHFVGVMEWSFSSPDRRLHIHRWSGGSLEPIGGIPLTPLARLSSGGWTWRRFLPMPLWDVAGGCAVLSDGSSPEIVVLSLESGERRAFRIEGHPRSEQELARLQASEQESILAFTREQQLPFSQVNVSDSGPRRWVGLHYGRDASLWVFPARESGTGVTALRVPFGPLAPDAHTLSLPGIPAAFLPDGAPLLRGGEHGEGWSDHLLRWPVPRP